MPTNATQELHQLYREHRLPPLSQELYAALDAIFEREGLRAWNYSNVATKLNVSRMTARAWLRGLAIPDKESCRAIARVTGLPEDHWLALAGHPTFDAMLTEVEKHRFHWSDGAYIYAALTITQDRPWRHSQSFWKLAAQDALERWHGGMSDEDLHLVALRVAMFIDAWNLDRTTRELPPPQRHIVALGA